MAGSAGIPRLHSLLASFRCLLIRNAPVYSNCGDVEAGAQRYTAKFDDPFSSHSLIYGKLLAEGVAGKRVLEVGVGDGSMAKRLCEVGGIVDGLDVDQSARDLAKPYCRTVYLADLEEIDHITLPDEPYDIIVMADVLEHIRNPEHVLCLMRRHLRPDGRLIVSLPNVANIYVRLNLLVGRFPYQSKGILDRSHVRFYTGRSAERLLLETGWHVVAREVTPLPLALLFPFFLRRPFRMVPWTIREITLLWKGLFAYQYIFYCK
jgi:2-polyprenyl-3-methyl-5-hydroxy-6-metoxy-1,4-benzoquinol methylase